MALVPILKDVSALLASWNNVTSLYVIAKAFDTVPIVVRPANVVILPCEAVDTVPANNVADNVPEDGLYVRFPSDSNPRLPPSTSPPAVKTTALSSSVLSLSVIVTVVATVATADVPEYPLDVIVPNETPSSEKVIVPPFASRVIPPSESKVTVVPANSAVPSAVICILAAAAAVSVVVISRVPFVPTVIVAVSPDEPVIVTILPSMATSSTVNAESVPNDVIFPWAAVAIVPVNSFTDKLANVNPEVVSTVVEGAALLFPVLAKSFHISESDASLNNPEYFVPLSTYLPYQPISTVSAELLSASANRGSSMVTVVLLTFVVVPFTVKLPLKVKFVPSALVPKEATPEEFIVIAPEIPENTYVGILVTAVLAFVPPPPLSIINKSASAIASPISDKPSMSNPDAVSPISCELLVYSLLFACDRGIGYLPHIMPRILAFVLLDLIMLILVEI